MIAKFRLITALGFAGVLAANSAAQPPARIEQSTSVSTVPAPSSLQDILRRAKSELSAERLPEVATSRRELEQALRDLEEFVELGSSNGEAWNSFLRLDELRAELEKDQPLISALADLEMNMRQNYVGLEYPRFVRLRERLNQFVRALRYGASPDNTIELLGKKIDELVEELNQPLEGSGLERSSQLGLVTNYLVESQQVPWAVSQLRSHFNVPNVEVVASESFLNRLIARPVVEPSPVDECILGTRILGQACLQGGLAVDVVPMFGAASLRLNMSATMTSRNKGYNRGVVLNTIGYSPVFVSKPIFVTPGGLSSGPSTISTHLQSQIQSIEHPLKIVRRIASKQAAQQKPMADSIAERRLQSRIQSQYDQQVARQLADANAELVIFRPTQRAELRRLGVDRPEFSLASSDMDVHGTVVQAAAYQLAASAPSPIPRPSDSELLVQVHQSALINTFDMLLGGRTIRSENLDEYAHQILGKVPPKISEEAHGEPWSISLAPFHPLEVEFVDNRARIILKISRMTRGEQVLSDPAIISAVYEPAFEDGVMTLRRQGPVSIDFTRESRGVRMVTLRSFLKSKFDATFQQEIVIQPINLQERFPRVPRLKLSALSIHGGWLQVGLN